MLRIEIYEENGCHIGRLLQTQRGEVMRVPGVLERTEAPEAERMLRIPFDSSPITEKSAVVAAL